MYSAPALRRRSQFTAIVFESAQPSTGWEECSPRGLHHAPGVPVKRPRFCPRPHTPRDSGSVCQGPRPQTPAALCEGAAARKVPRGVQARAPGSGCLPGVSATARPGNIPTRPSTAPRAGSGRGPGPHTHHTRPGGPGAGLAEAPATGLGNRADSRGPSLTFGSWALTSRFSRPLHPRAGGSRKRSRSSLKPGTVTPGLPTPPRALPLAPLRRTGRTECAEWILKSAFSR